MPAGSSSDSLALRFLLPQLQQCAVGAPETSVPGVGLETGAWMATLRLPAVLPQLSFFAFLLLRSLKAPESKPAVVAHKTSELRHTVVVRAVG